MSRKRFTFANGLSTLAWQTLIPVLLPVSLHQKREIRNSRMKIQKLNPVSIRIPVLDLDEFTEAASWYLNWLVSWPIAAVWLATCIYSLLSLAISWDRIGSVEIFSRDNFFWLIATWLFLKGIHELAHVLVCKKFGGKNWQRRNTVFVTDSYAVC